MDRISPQGERTNCMGSQEKPDDLFQKCPYRKPTQVGRVKNLRRAR